MKSTEEFDDLLKTKPTRRQVSVRLLLGTSIVLAILAVASYFWRQYQVNRLAPELLAQAEALEAEGKLIESTQRIYQYLQINPDDAEARITLAETYSAAADDMSRKLRAIELYSEALRDAPASKQPDLHRRLSSLLLDVARFQLQALDLTDENRRRDITARLTAASEEAAAVIEDQQDDPEAWRVLAWSLLGRHQLESLSEMPACADSVGAAFRRAVELNPADVRLAVQWARLYRSLPELLEADQQELSESERAERADAVVDQAVAAAAKDPATAEDPEMYLARSAYRDAYDLPGAAEDLAQALSLAPDSAPVQMACGLAAQRKAAQQDRDGMLLDAQSQRETAIDHFRRAREIAPDDVRPYLLLGGLYRQQGELETAVQVLEDGLAQTDEANLQLNAALAESLLDRSEQDEPVWKQVDRCLDTYDRAVERLRPLISQQSRERLEETGDVLQARLLVRRRDFGGAIALLDRLLLDPAALQTRNRLAAYRLLEQSHRALEQWQRAADAAEEVVRLEPEQVTPRILAAIDHMAAGAADRAVRQLTLVLARQDSVEILAMLIAACLEEQRSLPPSRRDWSRFQSTLAELEQRNQVRRIARPWRLVLLQAGYEAASAASGDDRGDTVRRLQQAELEYPVDAAFLEQLAALYKRLESEDDAERALVKLSLVGALQEQDWTTAEQWESQLQARQDSPASFWRYYRARRLLAQAAGPQDAGAAEAAELNAQLKAKYPTLRTVDVLQALAFEIQGDVADAVDAYQAAFESGERDPGVLRRLVLLLTQSRRFEEAEQVLAAIDVQDSDSTDLRGLEIFVQRSKGDRETALKLAQQDVEENPRDPLARLRLGRMYEDQGDNDAAENAYREAMILAPREIRAISAIFDLYAKTDRAEQAETLLDELAADSRLTASQRALLLSAGKELLDDRAAAEQVLRNAIRQDPDDVSLPLRLIDMLAARGEADSLAAAETAVNEALERFPDAADVKRRQANLLIRQGGQANRERALQIVQQLAGDPDQSRGSDASALAQLFDRQASWEQASQALAQAAASPAANARQLAVYVDRLLGQDAADEAKAYLTRLERLAPNDLNTMQLKIRWLQATGRSEEVPAVVDAYEQRLQRNVVAGQQGQTDIDRIIGVLCLQAGLDDRAESRFRKVLPDTPQAFGPLVAAVARQGRLDEAIQMCLDAAASDSSPLPVLTLLNVLTAGKPTPQQFQRAEPLLDSALQDHGDDPEVLFGLGALRLIRDETDQAIELFRKVIEIEPQNTRALNNLAVLLSESPETRDEALDMIDRALDIVGQRPTYLDTKATILLLAGQNEQAADLLETVVSGPEQNPVYQLHLAVAYARSGRNEEARQTLAQSLADGVQDGIMTATDRTMLAELEEKYQ